MPDFSNSKYFEIFEGFLSGFRYVNIRKALVRPDASKLTSDNCLLQLIWSSLAPSVIRVHWLIRWYKTSSGSSLGCNLFVYFWCAWFLFLNSSFNQFKIMFKDFKEKLWHGGNHVYACICTDIRTGCTSQRSVTKNKGRNLWDL